jgi:hypothetical protein
LKLTTLEGQGHDISSLLDIDYFLLSRPLELCLFYKFLAATEYIHSQYCTVYLADGTPTRGYLIIPLLAYSKVVSLSL